MIDPNQILMNMQKRERIFSPYKMRGDKSEVDDIPLIRARYATINKTDRRKADIDLKEYSKFYRFLVEEDIRPYREMLLLGLERIVVDDDCRSAIIDFDTAVDMVVVFYLRKFFVRNGCSENEINDLFDETCKKKKKYITTPSRIGKLSLFLFDSDKEFKEKDEFKNWQNIARKRRNEIIHQGRKFERKDAEENFKISQRFVLFVESECKKHHL